jgi:hypothetical protein
MPELATTLTATDEERLEQAEALVRAYCGWHIAPSRTETVEVRGKGGRTLMLPSLHVTDVVSVTADETLLVVEDDYVWTASGILDRGFYGCWSDVVVEVEMTHGYEEVPAEVTAAVQSLAQRMVDGTAGLTSKTIGPFSESYSGTVLSSSEMESLRGYRIPVVG